MNYTLIPINRTTIKKNPNAGQTISYRFCGPPEATEVRVFSSADGEKTKWERQVWVGSKVDGDSVIDGVLTMVQSTSIYKGLAAPWTPSLTYYQPRQIIYHRPISKYSYEYEDVQIKCNNCKASFIHRELHGDYNDDGGWNNEICPECGAWSCCDTLRYEQLNDTELEQFAQVA